MPPATCHHCRNVQHDVRELQTVLAHWFAILIGRFESQDHRLDLIVNAIVLSPGEKEDTCHSATFTPEVQPPKRQRNSGYQTAAPSAHVVSTSALPSNSHPPHTFEDRDPRSVAHIWKKEPEIVPHQQTVADALEPTNNAVEQQRNSPAASLIMPAITLDEDTDVTCLSAVTPQECFGVDTRPVVKRPALALLQPNRTTSPQFSASCSIASCSSPRGVHSPPGATVTISPNNVIPLKIDSNPDSVPVCLSVKPLSAQNADMLHPASSNGIEQDEEVYFPSTSDSMSASNEPITVVAENNCLTATSSASGRKVGYAAYIANESECMICGKKFSHYRNAFRHVKVHLYGKIFTCTICGRQFSTKVALERHVSRSHDEPSAMDTQTMAANDGGWSDTKPMVEDTKPTSEVQMAGPSSLTMESKGCVTIAPVNTSVIMDSNTLDCNLHQTYSTTLSSSCQPSTSLLNAPASVSPGQASLMQETVTHSDSFDQNAGSPSDDPVIVKVVTKDKPVGNVSVEELGSQAASGTEVDCSSGEITTVEMKHDDALPNDDSSDLNAVAFAQDVNNKDHQEEACAFAVQRQVDDLMDQASFGVMTRTVVDAVDDPVERATSNSNDNDKPVITSISSSPDVPDLALSDALFSDVQSVADIPMEEQRFEMEMEFISDRKTPAEISHVFADETMFSGVLPGNVESGFDMSGETVD